MKKVINAIQALGQETPAEKVVALEQASQARYSLSLSDEQKSVILGRGYVAEEVDGFIRVLNSLISERGYVKASVLGKVLGRQAASRSWLFWQLLCNLGVMHRVKKGHSQRSPVIYYLNGVTPQW